MKDTVPGFDDFTVDELRRRGTAKWTYHAAGVLAAWVAEMDFPVAPTVREALHAAVERSATGYAPGGSSLDLPAACATWLTELAGVKVEPRQIRVLADVLHGIETAIETFSTPGSPVIITTPSYPPFFEIVRVTGRQIVEIPMITSEGRWTFDLDAIDGALGAGAGTLVLCNPHNPLGRAVTREELAAVAAIVEARGARVVVDELHAPLVYPGLVHVPYASVSAAAAGHSVALISASKGWNIPGLKCAQLVLSNEEDMTRWDKLSHLRTHGASILGIVANLAAFEQGGPWLEQAVTYLDGNRRLLGDLLATYLPRVHYRMPEATYLAWLDCRELGLDNPSEFFLKQAKVAVNDGAAFGRPGQGWVRLNFATSKAILTTVVQAMAEAVDKAG